MKLAESVVFGGSGLDRAGELRGDPEAVAGLKAREGARAIALWQGKPLLCGDRQGELARLPLSAPVLAQATEPPILLGREDGEAVFGYDVSSWQPENMDPEALGRFLDPSQQHFPGLPDDHLFTELRSKMAWLSPRDAELAATAKAVLGWHRTHRFCSTCGVESAMAQSGWQRDCPACGTHHFPRTDPVVIMLITRGNKVLMGRSHGWPQGMYSLLAGFVEPGETIEAAVRREVFEETGVRVGPVGYLASQPWAFPMSLMIGCSGEALTDEIVLDPKELEAARWMTREEMVEVYAGRHPEVLPTRKGAIAQFLVSNWLADRLD